MFSAEGIQRICVLKTLIERLQQRCFIGFVQRSIWDINSRRPEIPDDALVIWSDLDEVGENNATFSISSIFGVAIDIQKRYHLPRPASQTEVILPWRCTGTSEMAVPDCIANKAIQMLRVCKSLPAAKAREIILDISRKSYFHSTAEEGPWIQEHYPMPYNLRALTPERRSWRCQASMSLVTRSDAIPNHGPSVQLTKAQGDSVKCDTVITSCDISSIFFISPCLARTTAIWFQVPASISRLHMQGVPWVASSDRVRLFLTQLFSAWACTDTLKGLAKRSGFQAFVTMGFLRRKKTLALRCASNNQRQLTTP